MKNVLERAILNCQGKVLTVDEFVNLEDTRSQSSVKPVLPLDKVLNRSAVENVIYETSQPVPSLKELEKSAIENALYHTGGNITVDARQLDIGRATLYRKMKEYEIYLDKSKTN